MRRRDFLAVLAGSAYAAAGARVASADDGGLRRVGALLGYKADDAHGRMVVASFVSRLAQLGWKAGDNLAIDYRWAAGSMDQMRANCAELIALKPDVIFAQGTPGTKTAKAQTTTIPIVFVLVVDPVGEGLVASLARPGGNVTGFTNFSPAMGGKWLQLLQQIAPRASRVAMLYNPDTSPLGPFFVKAMAQVAGGSALALLDRPVRDDVGIAALVADLAGDGGGGLIVLPDIFGTIHADTIITTANRARVPAVFAYPDFVARGGLVSYGIDSVDPFTNAAAYVDRILRGGAPADLPVQAPRKFELDVNLKTAAALGLTVPQSLLIEADKVIG